VLAGAANAAAVETHDLSGPEALTLDDVAERMTEVTGRPVRYERETPDEAYTSRAGYGAPHWEVEGWVTTYAAIAAGDLEVVTDTVERLSGHPPTDLTTVLRRGSRG
jgi:NAD(P)H dehydrogenase (quinone)